MYLVRIRPSHGAELRDNLITIRVVLHIGSKSTVTALHTLGWLKLEVMKLRSPALIQRRKGAKDYRRKAENVGDSEDAVVRNIAALHEAEGTQ